MRPLFNPPPAAAAQELMTVAAAACPGQPCIALAGSFLVREAWLQLRWRKRDGGSEWVRGVGRRREALESFSPRQLRLLMCLQPWQSTLTYSKQSQVRSRHSWLHPSPLALGTCSFAG